MKVRIRNGLAKLATISVASFAVLGCALTSNQSETSTDLSTPTSWLGESVWQFHVLDPDGGWIGSMDLVFSKERTDTCTSGDWKIVNVLHSTVGSVREVAYEIDGAHISIDLNADFCDGNLMMQGRLLETGAIGSVYYSTPFPPKNVDGNRGTFTAAPLRAH